MRGHRGWQGTRWVCQIRTMTEEIFCGDFAKTRVGPAPFGGQGQTNRRSTHLPWSHCFRLTWNDVIFSTRTITLKNRKTRGGNHKVRHGFSSAAPGPIQGTPRSSRACAPRPGCGPSASTPRDGSLRLVSNEKIPMNLVQLIIRHQNVATTERHAWGLDKGSQGAINILRMETSRDDLLPEFLPAKGRVSKLLAPPTEP